MDKEEILKDIGSLAKKTIPNDLDTVATTITNSLDTVATTLSASQVNKNHRASIEGGVAKEIISNNESIITNAQKAMDKSNEHESKILHHLNELTNNNNLSQSKRDDAADQIIEISKRNSIDKSLLNITGCLAILGTVGAGGYYIVTLNKKNKNKFWKR